MPAFLLALCGLDDNRSYLPHETKWLLLDIRLMPPSTVMTLFENPFTCESENLSFSVCFQAMPLVSTGQAPHKLFSKGRLERVCLIPYYRTEGRVINNRESICLGISVLVTQFVSSSHGFKIRS
ncbi:hypothetical protein N656DRAFT_776261 [Canariomyces notabilis]|uniref:Uncharacterized protein n=1 Tax=Canariomyces notabilis TaxID=2074819 RepID=A0AAN6TIS2_9PEZI|nr:hypothetical protein N656DRAFT_776261 [Canariomyces arenarius]